MCPQIDRCDSDSRVSARVTKIPKNFILSNSIGTILYTHFNKKSGYLKNTTKK